MHGPYLALYSVFICIVDKVYLSNASSYLLQTWSPVLGQNDGTLLISSISYCGDTEFLDHVGYESWSNYPEEEFNLADDSKWEVGN